MERDTVELVMDVEETFGIVIPDDVAQEIRTVGDLYDFITSKAKLAPAGTCLTAAAFYDIRGGLRTLGIDNRFAPSTQLVEILPNHGRRSMWSSLARITQFRLPNLVRPSWVVATGTVLTTAAALTVAFVSTHFNILVNAVPLIGFACLLVFGLFTSYITTPFASKFAPSFRTFRGLSERVLALNAAKFQNEHGAMGSNDIWIILKELIVDQLGVDPDEVTPEANFVKDLGYE